MDLHDLVMEKMEFYWALGAGTLLSLFRSGAGYYKSSHLRISSQY